jgi:glycosyltransferase involved in cell wall biosynthesis
MPTVSICLPVYNGEKYLSAAIDSVIAQTYADFELIIIDDLSQDDSGQIARAYASRDARIKVFANESNIGLFANYNACLHKVTGRFVKLFAQDDILLPQMLEKQLDVFDKVADVHLVSTKRLFIDEEKSHSEFCQFDSDRLIRGNDLITGCLADRINWIGEPSSVMFPSSLIGFGFDSNFHQLGDLEYWFRIVMDGNYVFLSEPLVSFRRHSGNATNKNVNSLLFAIDEIRLGRLYREYLADAGLSPEVYVRNVIENAALFVHENVRKQNLTALQSTSVDIKFENKDLLLQDFRELAFEALFLAGNAMLTNNSLSHLLEFERSTKDSVAENALRSSFLERSRMSVRAQHVKTESK